MLRVVTPIGCGWLEQTWDSELLKRADPYPSVWDDLDDEEAPEWREDLAVLGNEVRRRKPGVLERRETH